MSRRKGAIPADFIEYDGLTMSCYGWSKITGVPACTIYQRLKRSWDTKLALYTPVKVMVKRDSRRCACGKPIYSQKRDVCVLCHRKTVVWKNAGRQSREAAIQEDYVAPRAQEMRDDEVLAHVKDWIRVHAGFETHGPVIRYSPDSEIGRMYAGRM